MPTDEQSGAGESRSIEEVREHEDEARQREAAAESGEGERHSDESPEREGDDAPAGE